MNQYTLSAGMEVPNYIDVSTMWTRLFYILILYGP